MPSCRSCSEAPSSRPLTTNAMLLLLAAASLPTVMAQNSSCISLSGSTQCPAFNSSSISTDDSLTGLLYATSTRVVPPVLLLTPYSVHFSHTYLTRTLSTNISRPTCNPTLCNKGTPNHHPHLPSSHSCITDTSSCLGARTSTSTTPQTFMPDTLPAYCVMLLYRTQLTRATCPRTSPVLFAPTPACVPLSNAFRPNQLMSTGRIRNQRAGNSGNSRTLRYHKQQC